MFSLLHSSTIFVFASRRPLIRTVSMASNNIKHLRTQLNQLHTEADNTRDKANNARMRLLRLSEAAEKLQRQAAVDVQNGKENEARELLFQKKKVMQALEKSKRRVELLDEFLTKLNEAIFVIETQLVGTVALGLEFAGKDAPTTVRIISPAEDVSDEVLEWEDSAPSTTQNDKDEVRFNEESKDNLDISHQQKDIEGQKRTTMGIRDEDDLISSLMSISSYDDLLDHLDQQLRKIELEFVTVLSLSTLVLESEEKPKNSKVQQILEILEHVRSIRGRIASVMMKVKDVN